MEPEYVMPHAFKYLYVRQRGNYSIQYYLGYFLNVHKGVKQINNHRKIGNERKIIRYLRSQRVRKW